MAVIDAAYWESLCSREHKAAEEVTRADRVVIEATHWKFRLWPTVWCLPPVPTLDPELKFRGSSPPSLGRPEVTTATMWELRTGIPSACERRGLRPRLSTSEGPTT